LKCTFPYYRQEKQFEQIGATISRQDMSNWQQQAYEKLKPLFAMLKEVVKSGPVLQMNETEVQVIGERNEAIFRKAVCGWPVAALSAKK
jgi:transposase